LSEGPKVDKIYIYFNWISLLQLDSTELDAIKKISHQTDQIVLIEFSSEGPKSRQDLGLLQLDTILFNLISIKFDTYQQKLAAPSGEMAVLGVQQNIANYCNGNGKA
jgi:hypothetical protein